jgi:hypothetical protein
MLIKVIEKDDRKKKKMGRKRGDYNTAKETFLKKLRSLKVLSDYPPHTLVHKKDVSVLIYYKNFQN